MDARNVGIDSNSFLRQGAWPPIVAGMVLALGLWLAGCGTTAAGYPSGSQSTAQAAPAATPGSSPPQTELRDGIDEGSKNRVVVLSLDGAQALMMHRLYGQGAFGDDGFARFFRQGEVAEAMIPVNPTLTAPSHVSLITGVDPAETGIVSNRFRPAGEELGETASGFSAPIRAQTLWQAARSQGVPVGIVTYPGADDRGPGRRGDWGMAWNGSALRRPLILDLVAEDWATPENGASRLASRGGESFSPPRVATVDSGHEDGVIELLAVDTLDDDRTAYDAVWIMDSAASESRCSPSGNLLRRGRWVRSCSGVAFKVLALEEALATARIYVGGRWANLAYGGTYAKELARRGLQWPGPPDDDLLDARHETVADLETFGEQAQRFAEYFGDALVAGIESQDWRLLIGYIPVIDEVLHALPPGSEAGNEVVASVQRSVWQAVDRQLAQILAALDLETTTVFVVSDHGMMATETRAYPNGRLRSAGWIEIDAESGRMDRRESRALVETSGAVGHLYLGDSLPMPRTEALAELERLFETWRVDGKPVLERVVTGHEAKALGLDSANSGDLILFARPGVTLSWRSDRQSEPIDRLGMHGYLSHHPEMYGIFLALGAGVEVTSPGRVPSAALAARVRWRLGLDSDGR